MLETYSGATRLFPILGHPIAQVKAPNGLTRAFERRGRDAIVVPLHVTPEAIESILSAISLVKNIDGVIATVPHKFAAFRHARSASPRASFLGYANVLRRAPETGWHADMLDGIAFVRAIENAGAKVAASRVLLVGVGGAGSAIALELLDQGARELAIHDSCAERRDAVIEKLATAHPGKPHVGSADPSGYEIIINASPSGMRADDTPPVMLEKLGAEMFVGDVITSPEFTPLLRAARASGCLTQTGVGMFEANIDLMLDFFEFES